MHGFFQDISRRSRFSARKYILLTAFAAFGNLLSHSAESIPFQIHGQAWLDAGRIMKSSDTSVNYAKHTSINANGSWAQSAGAQFTATAELGSNLDAAFGFGAYQIAHSVGTRSDVNGNNDAQPQFLAISLTKSFITQARLTYFQGERQSPWLSFTLGNFSHNYNPDVKDLGLYLLRGPVYPGLLMGGFRDFSADTTKSNVMGARIHHTMGNFSHDVILMSEQELTPTFDWSLAYLASYKVGPLEVGAGVNFYRLIPYNNRFTNPSHRYYSQDAAVNALPYDTQGRRYTLEDVLDTAGAVIGQDTVYHSPYELKYIEVTPAGDTIAYTLQGTKVMARFALDLKSLIGIKSMGANDLRLYGEAAILGVKDYGTVYNKMSERMPVMLGFNVPTFGILDFLSIEGEWYGAKYRNDLAKIGYLNAVADWTIEDRPNDPNQTLPSAIPVSGAYPNSSRDNLKWAIIAEKTVKNHIRFTGQIADDHYRPRPMATSYITSDGGTAEAFTTPKDWYFMFRMGYFF